MKPMIFALLVYVLVLFMSRAFIPLRNSSFGNDYGECKQKTKLKNWIIQLNEIHRVPHCG